MNACARGVARTLEPRPASVGEARRLVRAELHEAGREDLVETAQLLVTEVVTNALVHAGTPIELVARVDGSCLRVEVGDGSPAVPAVLHRDALAGTGRGLRMMQHLVDAWGVEPYADGKVVWFEVSTGDREDEWLAADLVADLAAELGGDLGAQLGAELAAEERAGAERAGAVQPDPADRAGETVDVVLLDVPLVLHVAWRQHAEALLREHLLYALADDEQGDADDSGPGEGAADPVRDHAAASHALALLAAHLPDPSFGEDPERLMETAVEDVVSSDRQVVPVSVEARGELATLDRILEEAIALADAGLFLNVPTQPEVRAFRHWLREEVERQWDGGEPRPWRAPESTGPPDAFGPLSWDARVVTDAADALVAADDTNGIVAVSPAALELLGYDDPRELVGHRLLRIIPARYHQAHLAGFTLHLTTGRDRLLDRSVTVPVVRRDGTETTVALTITVHHLPAGRSVFVADLQRR